ncbi:helix-turn-helix domain-containing protein [Streptomyces sp. NPDC088847]|uniref:helix-turn-helix domain-containing protein n=1 Tax=Streptomyces sp. NPDC088847 TaxID=3365909 RepID=UPI003805177F
MTTAVRDGRRVIYRPRMTEQDRTATAARLRQRYEKGSSVRSVAADAGLSYGTAYRLLQSAGTQLRDRAGRLPADQPTTRGDA